MNQTEPNVKMAIVAKRLNIGSKTLFQKLRDANVLKDDNTPRSQYVQRGLFQLIHKQYVNHSKKEYRNYYLTLVTPQGEQFIQQTINKPPH